MQPRQIAIIIMLPSKPVDGFKRRWLRRLRRQETRSNLARVSVECL